MVNRSVGSRTSASSSLVASAVFFITMVSFFRVPFLAAIGSDLGLTNADLAGIAVAYAVGRLSADLPAAILTDRVHPYRLLSAGAVIAAIGATLFARATNLVHVWGGAFLLGSATALVNSAGLWHFSSATDDRRRGTSVSIYSSTLLVGQAIGPLVATLLALDGTWRSSHGIAVIALALYAILLLTRKRPATARGSSPRVNPPTADNDEASRDLWPLVFLCIVPFYMFGVFVSTIHTLIPIIGAELGLTPGTIGIALGVGGAARLLAIILGGRVSDRFSRTLALIVALLLTAAGLVMLAMASSYLVWLGSVIALSAGSIAISTSATMIADISPSGRVGRNLGPWRFVGDIGMTVLPLGLGWAVATSTTTPVLIATAGMAVVLGVVALGLRHHHPRW